MMVPGKAKSRKRRVLLITQEDDRTKELERKVRSSLGSQLGSVSVYKLVRENGKLGDKSVAEGIAKLVTEMDLKEVFIDSHLSYDTLVNTVMSLERNDIDFMLSPEVYERCMGAVGRTDGWILPAVRFTDTNLPPFYRIAKRVIDIFISICTLILLSPLFLIVPVLIKLTSRGPVFFTQLRCGINGQCFKIYKFRSMIPDAEKLITNLLDFDKLKEPVFKLRDDPRITFIGRVLRKSSIDELPQLLNVLKGDLTLVGPRPEEIGLVRRYNHYFKERLKVKPGITGLQQVTCRGSTSLTERVKHDLGYIRNMSLWLDIKILFKTVWVVLAQQRVS